MHILHEDLESNGVIILSSVKSMEHFHYNERNFDKARAIIINGEGTMHHNAPLACQYLDLILKAASSNKKIFLINTVWQDMFLSSELIEILQNSYISVRDIKSQRELEKNNIKSHFHLDLSYSMKVPFSKSKRDGLVMGTFSMGQDKRKESTSSINIFTENWEDLVTRLSKADYLITSRHHEMYAACLARCPFYIYQGNSWKNEGLLEAAGAKIPCRKEDTKVLNFMKGNEYSVIFHEEVREIEDNRQEYDKLFNWMEDQKPFTFKGLL
jgi:hypothetical protein